MNGVFVRKQFLDIIYIVIVVLFGGFMAADLFFMIVDGITFQLLLSACIACIFVAYLIFRLFFNRGAYFHLNEEGISAYFSWNTELACSYSEICFCEYGTQALALGLKNGKRYVILNLFNAVDLCREIRKRIQDENTGSLTELYYQIHSIQRQRTQWIYWRFHFNLYYLFVHCFGHNFYQWKRPVRLYTG